MNRRQLARMEHGFGFDPQDAVRWLAPRELARAGVKAVLSAVFADYADKREIQAGLGQGPIPIPGAAPDSKDEFWFDYTADVGDGFDATFTIASLLAEESVTVPIDGVDTPLPRGKMLVLGGDEVYPTASSQAYEDRMTGPYRAAFPHADPQPLLIALPGNHDWYDGLTSFLRTFTHRRSIGGWKTAQSRSYFAVQLPHRWWLVGLDSQFESYIDEPQLQYFEDNFTKFLEKGDSVILCSASPTWLKTHHDPDAFNPLFWFEKNYIRGRRVGDTEKREPTGAEVRIWLTGDSHHYARYVEKPAKDVELPADTARQMVTCGIGGAYLSSTHNLPEVYRILPAKSRSFKEGDTFTDFAIQETLYPNAEKSRALVNRLAMPWSPSFLLWRNPGLLPLFAGIHTALFLGLFLLFGQGKQPPEGTKHGSVVATYLEAGPGQVWRFTLSVFFAAAIGAAIIYVLPMARFKPPFVRLSNLAAVLSQVAVVLGVFLLLGCLVAMHWVGELPDIVIILLVSGLAAIMGGLVGGFVFGISIVCFRQGAPTTWQLSGQSIEDCKGFLRLRISTDGTLTVFPLVVDEVNRDWAITPFQSTTDATTGAPGKPVPVPRASNGLPKPRLLEQPYRVTRTAGSPTP